MNPLRDPSQPIRSSVVLPNSTLTKMRPEDRESLGRAGMTAEEAQAAYTVKTEKEMHAIFEAWLNLRKDEIYWDHSRMDRGTSNRPGHPDFVIQHKGRALNIELKLPKGKLSDKQEVVHAWILRTGSSVHTCFTAQDAIAITRKEFGL